MAARFSALFLFGLPGILVVVLGASVPAQNRIETGSAASSGAVTNGKTVLPDKVVNRPGPATDSARELTANPAPVCFATNWGGRTLRVRSGASVPRKALDPRLDTSASKGRPAGAETGAASRSSTRKDTPAVASEGRGGQKRPASEKGKRTLDPIQNRGQGTSGGHVNMWDARTWKPRYGRTGYRVSRWNRSSGTRSRLVSDNQVHTNTWDIR